MCNCGASAACRPSGTRHNAATRIAAAPTSCSLAAHAGTQGRQESAQYAPSLCRTASTVRGTCRGSLAAIGGTQGKSVRLANLRLRHAVSRTPCKGAVGLGAHSFACVPALPRIRANTSAASPKVPRAVCRRHRNGDHLPDSGPLHHLASRDRMSPGGTPSYRKPGRVNDHRPCADDDDASAANRNLACVNSPGMRKPPAPGTRRAS